MRELTRVSVTTTATSTLWKNVWSPYETNRFFFALNCIQTQESARFGQFCCWFFCTFLALRFPWNDGTKHSRLRQKQFLAGDNNKIKLYDWYMLYNRPAKNSPKTKWQMTIWNKMRKRKIEKRMPPFCHLAGFDVSANALALHNKRKTNRRMCYNFAAYCSFFLVLFSRWIIKSCTQNGPLNWERHSWSGGDKLKPNSLSAHNLRRQTATFEQKANNKNSETKWKSQEFLLSMDLVLSVNWMHKATATATKTTSTTRWALL